MESEMFLTDCLHYLVASVRQGIILHNSLGRGSNVRGLCSGTVKTKNTGFYKHILDVSSSTGAQRRVKH